MATTFPTETLAALRALSDLDLGALASFKGIDPENVSSTGLAALLATNVPPTAGYHLHVRDALHDAPGGLTDAARHVAALGAKVRAALPDDTRANANPFLVTQWTVSGENGTFAVVQIYAPPDPDVPGKLLPICSTLQRTEDPAAFVREGWLKRETRRVSEYLRGR